jgi:hypothetical protein
VTPREKHKAFWVKHVGAPIHKSILEALYKDPILRMLVMWRLKGRFGLSPVSIAYLKVQKGYYVPGLRLGQGVAPHYNRGWVGNFAKQGQKAMYEVDLTKMTETEVRRWHVPGRSGIINPSNWAALKRARDIGEINGKVPERTGSRGSKSTRATTRIGPAHAA